MSEQEKPSAYMEQSRKLASMFIDAISNPKSEKYLMPWSCASSTFGGQYNPATGKAYNGGNQFYLSLVALEKGVGDDRWLTFRQVQDLGLKLRKGAKAEKVFYYEKKAAEPSEATNEGEAPKDKYIAKSYNVFNGSDVVGLEPMKKRELPGQEWQHEECEKVIAKMNVPIEHVEGNKCYYLPQSDTITLPLKSQFHSERLYYSTALHELGHATGHKSRLNRDLSARFGTPSYAKEELRAEIASMLMAQRLGIPNDQGQHVAYVKSWVKILEEKPQEIMRACADAEKICHFMGVHAQVKERLPVREKTPEELASIEEGKASLKKIEAVSQEQARTQARQNTVARNQTRAKVKEQSKSKSKTKSHEHVKIKVRRAPKKEHTLSM